MQNEVIYIILGWALGSLISIAILIRTSQIQNKKEKKNDEIAIIYDSLKFMFRIKQAYSDLSHGKIANEVFSKYLQGTDEERKNELQSRLDKVIGDFFMSELMLHSFQLSRLDDKTYMNDFNNLIKKFTDLIEISYGKIHQKSLQKLEEEAKASEENYVKKCHDKTKI